MTKEPNLSREETPVWFITGCSTGLGRSLAKAVLDRGWRAVVTARDTSKLADLVEGAGERALAVELDLLNPAHIAAAAAAAHDKFGRVDVLVNNAGYGYQASVEEGVDAEIRELFETNVFGLFALTRAILPGMRARRRGHVISVTSIAGFIGLPGSGYYAATKHAVEGWSEALAAECGPLGIHVSCVEPGPFRTDWAGRSLRQTPSQIADYAQSVDARMKATSRRSGTQRGDPERAAAVMIRLTELETPPQHLVLGASGFDMVTEHLRRTAAEVEAWRELGASADFPDKA